MRMQAVEKTLQSGLEARYSMEQSYRKAVWYNVAHCKACFEVVNDHVHPKRAFQLLPGERSGRQGACTTRLVDGSGEGREHKKMVLGLPRRLHPWEETDAVQQMRDKQTQVDVAIRELCDWLELALLHSD